MLGSYAHIRIASKRAAADTLPRDATPPDAPGEGAIAKEDNRTMTLRTLLAPCLFAMLSSCASTATTPIANPATASLDLRGHWVSPCVPNGHGQHIKLDFTMTATAWALDYVTSGDAACASPFITARIEGPDEITGRSAVPDASEASFRFTRKSLTAHDAMAAGFLSSPQGCGTAFTAGVATDISATGCAGLGQRPIAACGQDFDLVSVQGDALHFGNRPDDNDMCTAPRRPTALSPLAMQRQH